MTERAGGLKCGAASVEITPAKLIGMAGYSRAGKIAKGASGRLFARSLLFDDGAGRRLAFCFIDLMSASRYLLDAATRRTGGLLNPEQLLLAGTHTHTGPGRFYGNPFYDHFAQVDSGFDRDLADTLAAGIAASLMRAAEHAVPARVGFATTELWGYSRNRSLIPFLENTASAEWAAIHPPPPNLPADFQAIDPRVRVVSAVRADTSALIGSFATFSCHATALGEGHDMYDPDWPGVAVEIAAHAFPPDAVVAIAAGTAADMSPTRDSPQQSPELARLVGEQVGAAVVKASCDIGGGVRLFRQFGVGMTVSQHKSSELASISFSAPHPLFVGRPATASGPSEDPLTQKELALHIEARYIGNLPYASISVFAGPSHFHTTRDMIEDFSYLENLGASTLNYTVSLAGNTTQSHDSSTWGFNSGVDVGYYIGECVGFGALLRYSKAQVDLPNLLTLGAAYAAAGSGGMNVGGGVRFRF